MNRVLLFSVFWLFFPTIPAYAVVSDTVPNEASEVDKTPIEGSVNHISYFLLQISRAQGINVSVDYTTRAATALAGQDFVATSGTATIRAGDTKTVIGVEIIADTLSEENEYFNLAISNPKGLNFPQGITEISSQKTIVDDDQINRRTQLQQAMTWMYQIQGLDETNAVATLAETNYPLLVLEPGHNFSDFAYDTQAMLQSLRTTPSGKKRVILAYIDIGQAEDYRNYWQAHWSAPTATSRGQPDFLVSIDPDGWSGNYPVAYWDQRWKAIWLGDNGIIAQLTRLGFDGVYLDWVEAYDDEHILLAAAEEGVDAKEEMLQFIEDIGSTGRALVSDFLVVAQNAPYLIDSDPIRYAAAIDALAVEDTWWHGNGDAQWDDPDAGDLHERHFDEYSTESRLVQYKKYIDRSIPVFSVDYCISQSNADQVYTDARLNGMRPLVTRVSLSRLTETPPENSP